jgi:hypothetical protein
MLPLLRNPLSVGLVLIAPTKLARWARIAG